MHANDNPAAAQCAPTRSLQIMGKVGTDGTVRLYRPLATMTARPSLKLVAEALQGVQTKA